MIANKTLKARRFYDHITILCCTVFANTSQKVVPTNFQADFDMADPTNKYSIGSCTNFK